MSNGTRLFSSGIEFISFEPSSNYYADSSQILNNKNFFKNIINKQGFLVVRNLIDKEKIEELRDKYYFLFGEEYKKKNNQWYQFKEPKDPHGYGNHPVKRYLKSSSFIKFINDPFLNKIVSILLDTNEAVLSKRVLVRSFSSLSTFTTRAHRDKEYYVSSNPSKVVTSWMPLGPVGKNHGQLVYLENSHNFSFIDKSNEDKKDRIISKNLNELAQEKKSRWLIPKINYGDVIFHCLNTVHASFDSNTLVPRLSCDLRFASSIEYLDSRWHDYWYGEDGL